MNLYLSSSSPLNTTFTTETGQVIYKIQTRNDAGYSTSRITRVTPSPKGSVDQMMKDHFVDLAKINWHKMRHASSRLSISSQNTIPGGPTFGQDLRADSLFRKEGRGLYGRHQVFEGPDGQEYKWKTGTGNNIIELVLNDTTKKVVARVFKSHRFRVPLLSLANQRQGNQWAGLEIMTDGLALADMILVTFVYVQKEREDHGVIRLSRKKLEGRSFLHCHA